MYRLDSIIEKYGIEKLNSFTKYPSIKTYHSMNNKGILQNYLTEQKSFSNYEKCFVTEKIDGTNSRIIIFNGDFFIGSRDTFLYAKGDRIFNENLSIVSTVKPYAEKICKHMPHDNCLYAIFGETYGGKGITKASKQYTNSQLCNFRIFDVFSIDENMIESLLKNRIDYVSSWRENNNQKFYNVDELIEFSNRFDTEVVPYIEEINGINIPLDLKDTYKWLLQFKLTKAGIDNTGDSEGVVIRDFDRKSIFKLRFEDYNRAKKVYGF